MGFVVDFSSELACSPSSKLVATSKDLIFFVRSSRVFHQLCLTRLSPPINFESFWSSRFGMISTMDSLSSLLCFGSCLPRSGFLMQVVVVLLALAVVGGFAGLGDGHCLEKNAVLVPRPHSVSILEFGAVGDGVTSNTVAFQNAIFYLKSFVDKGGAQLYVPRGRWLTGSFNITSHLTLFLDKDAVLLATQDSSQWPIIDPLPSYGQGIDVPGSRHRSLINGNNLTDVIITGENGTIDGQGLVWWDCLQSGSLNYSRPHIVELINCDNIIISNLTFLNSPAWSIHPVYSSGIHVQNVTIVNPADSVETSGIVPDSCTSVCIEDCSITVSHDAISLKSGWDKYGISYAKPVSDVYINRIKLQSTLGSALAFGSEMSGGISNIHADDLHIYDSLTGINFKTAIGRGGFIQNVVISNVVMENVDTAIEFFGQSRRHPDDDFDLDAFPVIDRITLKDMVGTRIQIAGNLSGIEHDPFTAICLSNLDFSDTLDPAWYCSNVWGISESVFPQPCAELSIPYLNSSSLCFSLENFSSIQTA